MFMPTSLVAGSAKVDITPPLTIPYLGYEPRHAFFTGIRDRLYARAVALDDGTTPVIIISADAIGYSNAILGPGRHFTAEVRQRITQQTGVPGHHIMLATTHAHSTPETIHLRRLLDTPAAAPWLEVIMDQLASVATMAWTARCPSQIKAGTGAVEGMSRNRRVIGVDGRIVGGPEHTPKSEVTIPQPLDTQLAVLLIEALDGATCTVLTNFACHPVTVQVQPLVSADFPGAAMALVERTLPGCTHSLFLQGACGNINPIRNTTDFADVDRYGLMLGGEAIKVAARLHAPSEPAVAPQLAVAVATPLVAVRELPDHMTTQQAFADAGKALANATSADERTNWRRKQRMVEEALVLIERGAAPIPAEVQVVRIGDIALVALPGEPFVELGLAIKARSPARQTWVVGYANDWIGYLTTPEAWAQGGYEVGAGPWTRVGPQGGGELVEQALTLLNQLWTA